MQDDPIVIVGSARTPMGGFQGSLSDVSAPELGGVAIRAAVERAGVKPEDIEDVVMGLCLFAGLKQAPARQAAHHAGLSWDAGCTTLSKMCGSAMKATMLAHDNILAGSHDVMVAGGMESMTNAPYILPRARQGYRLGHGDQAKDHMFLDGLEDAYDEGRLMGTFAEDTAQHYQFTREQQDDFAIESLNRAKKAVEDGTFEPEIEPVNNRTMRISKKSLS
jgi:acetyl-CoA C-acetyltransferase